jgi:hypothetical protein
MYLSSIFSVARRYVIAVRNASALVRALDVFAPINKLHQQLLFAQPK